jgi:hypothetical protein
MYPAVSWSVGAMGFWGRELRKSRKREAVADVEPVLFVLVHAL